MSVKIMSAVWESAPYKGGTLLVLLALADWANDQGIAWPSVPTLAKKARLKKRNAQYAIAKLEQDGFLHIDHGGGGRKSNMYALDMQKLHLSGCPAAVQKNAGEMQKPTREVQPIAPDPLVDPLEPPTSPLPPKKSHKPPIEIAVGPPPPYTGEEFLRQLGDFEANRKKLKCPLNELSRVRVYNVLATVDEATATQALDDSIQNGWKGVFPERVTQNGANGHKKNSDDRPIWMASKK